MTVEKLIKVLKAMPQDSEVEISRPFNLELGPGDSAPVGTISSHSGVTYIAGQNAK